MERRPIHIRLGVIVAGSVLVLAGIAGLFLPIVPGWLLIIPGLALLATEFVWAERVLDMVKARFSQAREIFDRHRERPEISEQSGPDAGRDAA